MDLNDLTGFKNLSGLELFAPLAFLDYIYAMLHSPICREKYKEFLKIDFPRVPYPKDLSTFEKLTNLGAQIRQIHLLESVPKAFGIEIYITEFNIDYTDKSKKYKVKIDNEFGNKTFEDLNEAKIAAFNGIEYFKKVQLVIIQ